jgi:hypothetical protein
MSSQELIEIIEKGKGETEMTFDEEAAYRIVRLSAGLPHYTHTLALHAAENAIDDDRVHITMADVDAAIHLVVEMPGHLLSMYEKATESSRQTYFKEILLACALAKKTELGFFTSVNVRAPLEQIMGKKVGIPAFSGHLNAFCSEARGKVLQKFGSDRRWRFRFENPLLQPFVIIHGLAKGLIPPEMLSFSEEPEQKKMFPNI